MALYTEWDAVFNGITAMMVALLGLFVWTIRPRSRDTILLGLFAVFHGLHFTMENLWDTRGQYALSDLRVGLESVGYLVAGTGLVLLARGWMRRRSTWIGYLVAAAALGLLGATLYVITDLVEWTGLRNVHQAYWLGRVYTQGLFAAAFGLLPLALALEFRAHADEAYRMKVLVVSTALIPWPAMWGMHYAIRNGQDGLVGVTAVVAFIALLASFAWLANVSRAGTMDKAARRLSVFTLGLLTVATVDAVLLVDRFDYSRSGGILHGLSRFVTTIGLVYAITRLDLLGVVDRLRWGVSKSTVAAVFVAVFFIASEGASEFFGDQFQSEYLGIAAAGAMVFAIAPLNRFADRLAERALPTVEGSTALRAYRVTYQALNADGELSNKDLDALAVLAAELELSPVDVRSVERLESRDSQ